MVHSRGRCALCDSFTKHVARAFSQAAVAHTDGHTLCNMMIVQPEKSRMVTVLVSLMARLREKSLVLVR